jgi:hypothetical protein
MFKHIETSRYHACPTCPCDSGLEHDLSLQTAHVHWPDCRASAERFSATGYMMDRSSILMWIGLLFASIGIILSFSWSSIFNYILRKVRANKMGHHFHSNTVLMAIIFTFSFL